MGRGDKKTAKGKRSMGSYGNARPKKTNNSVAPVAAPKKVKKAASTKSTEKVAEKATAAKATTSKTAKAETAKKPAAKKAPAKKAAPKKKEAESK